MSLITTLHPILARRGLLPAALAGAVLILCSTARAGIITFDGVPTGSYGDSGMDATPDLTVDGFKFETNGKISVLNEGNPKPSIRIAQWSQSLYLSTASGNPFTLTSVDMQNDWSIQSDATVTGTYAAGGTVSTTILNTNSAKRVFVTFPFDSQWQGLSSVQFNFAGGVSNAYGDMDNFNVTETPIPEPASLVLLGLSGMMLLTSKRRRVPARA